MRGCRPQLGYPDLKVTKITRALDFSKIFFSCNKEKGQVGSL